MRALWFCPLLIPCLFAGEISFEDATDEMGLSKPLAGLMGHGAAWGDVDRDGLPDLFVGGFSDRPDADYAPASGPVASRLLLNGKDGFRSTGQALHHARTSGAVFADLDNDGWLDLYVANNRKPPGRRSRGLVQDGAKVQGSMLFHNRDGTLTDVSPDSGACPPDLGTARNVAVFDLDHDGLLDLLVIEDRFTKNPRSRLFRNLGGMRFEEKPLPEGLFGLGCAVADVNEDGFADVFVGHSNRLLLGGADGFREHETLNATFAWTPLDGEDWPCGAAFADLNRDGRLDLVLSIHGVRSRNKVYLHDGVVAGIPQFRDVTAATGIPAELPQKAPHVEVQDFDNDGWPDLYLSAAWKAEDGSITPCVLRHEGLKDGVPQFRMPRKPEPGMVYFPAGPSADVDRDGRVDLCLVNWFAENHTRLLRNTSGKTGRSGNWLVVRAEGTRSNRMGLGTKVRVRHQGKLIHASEISTGYGYASGQEAVAHVGLGEASSIDLELVFPSGSRITRKAVAANQRLTVKEIGAEEPASPGLQAVPAAGLLQAPAGFDDSIRIAKTPPKVDVMVYPGQNTPGNPWSVWGDGVFKDGVYWSAIGDHMAPVGNAFVYAFDPGARTLDRRLDLRSILKRPEGWYTPGKIHSNLGFGKDGWLYFSTHRGGTRATTKANHFEGAWIMRHHPDNNVTEVVAAKPLPGQTLPCGIVDGERMLFYAGSAQGDHREKGSDFLVYNLAKREIVYTDKQGPKRAMILTNSGKVYYHPWERTRGGPAKLRCFDPSRAEKKPFETASELSLRAASRETADGKVYTVDRDGIWSFDVKTEATEFLGAAAVGSQTYVTSLDADPTGRFLYYTAGAHGGGYRDGTPVVRFDTRTRTREVIAFLDPAVHQATGYIPMGSYASALSDDGKTLFITFNGNAGTTEREAQERLRFDTCGLVVLTLAEE